MSLDWATLMTETNGLSLIFINFLCSSTHTTTPLQWGHTAAFWEHDPLSHVTYVHVISKQG